MIAALMLAAAALAPLQPPWDAWRYQRRIEAGSRTATVSFVVPASLYMRAQPDLADLRIVSEDTQVPFAIVTPAPGPDVHWLEARVQDTGYVRDHYSQAVGAFQHVDEPYEMLEVQTPERSFAARATVEASEDGRVWRIVRRGAPLYDFSKDGLDTNLRIAIAPTTARLVRIRIEGLKPLAISGIRAAQGVSEPAPLTRYAVNAQRRESREPKSSVYLLDGAEEVPFSRVDVYAVSPRYARRARLEFNDGDGWQTFAHAQLVHTPERDEHTFAFDEVQIRKWRLIIENDDNRPLEGVRVYAFGAARRVVFDARAGGSYRLLYGNPLAEMPAYDFAATHPHELVHAPVVVLEPALESNMSPQPRKQEPWSERHRWILWASLALMACVAGGLALRALRNGEVT